MHTYTYSTPSQSPFTTIIFSGIELWFLLCLSKVIWVIFRSGFRFIFVISEAPCELQFVVLCALRWFV